MSSRDPDDLDMNLKLFNSFMKKDIHDWTIRELTDLFTRMGGLDLLTKVGGVDVLRSMWLGRVKPVSAFPVWKTIQCMHGLSNAEAYERLKTLRYFYKKEDKEPWEA